MGFSKSPRPVMPAGIERTVARNARWMRDRLRNEGKGQQEPVRLRLEVQSEPGLESEPEQPLPEQCWKKRHQEPGVRLMGQSE
jgi:hypothetical protein